MGVAVRRASAVSRRYIGRVRLLRIRRIRPPRLDAFEAWIVVVVAAVVALGLLGDTYQRYQQDSMHQRLSLLGFDREHWGDYFFTYIDADPSPETSVLVASFDEIDGVLNQATEEGADVIALRVWTGVLTNPTTGATHTLVPDLGQPNHAVASFGVDWDGLGLIVDGHAPRPGEIALSRNTARALGVGLGDTILTSDSMTPNTLSLTVGGILRDTAVWTLGDSLYLFAESDSYSAVVNWDDSETLSRALRPRPRILLTETYWNGPSESLAEYPGALDRPASHEKGERWGPGPMEFVSTAWALAALAALTALVLGSRPRRRPLRWATPVRTIGAAIVGTAAGAITAVLLAALTYVALPTVVPDLVQPGFGLFSLANIAWWLGVAGALTLALEVAARVRGTRLWQSRPAHAIAALARRAAPVVRWLPALGAAAVLATILWASLDVSMIPQSWGPPDSVLVPHVVGLTIFAGGLAAFVARRARGGAGLPDTLMPGLSMALALMAGILAFLANGLGTDIAGDAAQRYDTTNADIATSFGLDDTIGGDIFSGFSDLFRTVDTGTMASIGITFALGLTVALLLAGLGERTLTWRARVTVAALGLAVMVGAFVVGAVSGALLAAPIEVHDVSSFAEGLQPGTWTVSGGLDVAFGILDAATWLAVSTALALGLVVAATSALGKTRSRLT